MKFLRLHKPTINSFEETGTIPVWINFEYVVRIDEHLFSIEQRGSHIDFTDSGLEEEVVETPEEIFELLSKHFGYFTSQ